MSKASHRLDGIPGGEVVPVSDALGAEIRGMDPVLGNGVASDIGCWMEATVAAKHICNAGEFNGFLRPVSGILVEPLRVDSAAMVLTPDFVPELDRDKIATFSVATERSDTKTVAVGPAAQ